MSCVPFVYLSVAIYGKFLTKVLLGDVFHGFLPAQLLADAEPSVLALLQISLSSPPLDISSVASEEPYSSSSSLQPNLLLVPWSTLVLHPLYGFP